MPVFTKARMGLSAYFKFLARVGLGGNSLGSVYKFGERLRYVAIWHVSTEICLCMRTYPSISVHLRDFDAWS